MPRTNWLAAALVSVCAASASALWISDSERVPVDRLVSNLTRQVDESPDDAHGHYVLGRVHSLAWARGAGKVLITPTREGEDWPSFSEHQSVRVTREQRELTVDDQLHFHASVAHYQNAVRLDDDVALYHLGLAWMIDRGIEFVRELKTPDGSEVKSAIPAEESHHYRVLIDEAMGDDAEARAAKQELYDALPRSLHDALVATEMRKTSDARKQIAWDVVTRYWEDRALVHYRRAHELNREADLKLDSIAMEGDGAISEEAAKGIVAILSKRPETEAIKEELAHITKYSEKMDEKPRWITPVMFPAAGHAPLADLIDPQRIVEFDMDGDDVPGHWPWVSDDAAFLVWTPNGAADVTSGRALFGSVTWWIAWRDGYEPLAALDDDGDGELAGAELDGIGVWRDANGDARATDDEVQPAREYGIDAITVAPDHRHDGVPAASIGVRLTDGTTRPTYDWTPERVPDPRP